jgi:hypothetical protein
MERNVPGRSSMIWNRNCGSAVIVATLHDNMATPLPDLGETVSLKYGADITPGEDAKLTQLTPQLESQIRRHHVEIRSHRATRIRRITRRLHAGLREQIQYCHLDWRCLVLNQANSFACAVESF